MNRNDVIKFLSLILGLQLLFVALHYFGGFDVSPAVSGGLTAGLMTTYLARRRRKSA